ncbi:MAG: hypothetical protein U0271_35330 [Polyangiaceae bacterium]
MTLSSSYRPIPTRLFPVLLLGSVACGATPAPCPEPNPPAPVIGVPLPCPPTKTPAGEPLKVAVLPIDDNELYRAERAELRAAIFERLRSEPDLKLVPLDEVDKAIRPRSKAGAYCAYERRAPVSRASQEGWAPTDLATVVRENTTNEELWLHIGFPSTVAFAAPWDRKSPLMDRYKSAIQNLERRDAPIGLLGILGGRPNRKAPTSGAVSICESSGFMECAAESAAWLDRATELSACVADVDDQTFDVLVESGRCELVGLDDVGGALGKREACICNALKSSARAAKLKARAKLELRVEATDLAGKPRPDVTVVDVTSNLDSDLGWTGALASRGGEARHVLTLDNLESLEAALSRCELKSTALAELTIDEAGFAADARLATPLKDKKVSACVGAALKKAAFPCTKDGKSAIVRLVLDPPAEEKKPSN